MMTISFYLIIILANLANCLIQQDTLYNYNNRTVYVHLKDNDNEYNSLLKFPFDEVYNSGDLVSTVLSTPHDPNCQLVAVSDGIIAFCNAKSGYYDNLINTKNSSLIIEKYNYTSDSWDIHYPVEEITYFNSSTYIHSRSDPDAVYIFSGFYPNSSELSDRMYRLDLNTYKVSNASTSVQPRPFYNATLLEINSNTEMILGGMSDNELVSIEEIPVWQYNSWAERPANIKTSQDIHGRTGALVLPVFDENNAYTFNETAYNFEVSLVLILGGFDESGNASYPNIAKLNVSTNIWEWEDMSNQLLLANSYNKKNKTTLNLSNSIAAVVIYDTLVVIDDNTKNSKRNDGYTINLFDVDTLQYKSSVNYTTNQFSTNKKTYHTNKSLIIALSVIIPVLVLIILACFIFFTYRRYRQRKEQELNEKEISEIVDFYQNQAKQLSNSSFSSGTIIKESYSEESLPYSGVLINNFDDGDNLSINRTPLQSQSFLFRTISTISKNLQPVSKHFYKNNHSPHSAMSHQSISASLNYIPENSKVSTFQNGSSPLRYQRANTESTTKSSLPVLLEPENFENEDTMNHLGKIKKSDSRQSRPSIYINHNMNPSNGSINELNKNLNFMDMIRRMSTKKGSRKLRIANPDVEVKNTFKLVQEANNISNDNNEKIKNIFSKLQYHPLPPIPDQDSDTENNNDLPLPHMETTINTSKRTVSAASSFGIGHMEENVRKRVVSEGFDPDMTM